jgi:hypothetical protein
LKTEIADLVKSSGRQNHELRRAHSEITYVFKEGSSDVILSTS